MSDVRSALTRLRLIPLFRRVGPHIIKLGTAGIALLVSILVARIGGPSTLGQYALIIQSAQLLTVFVLFGHEVLATRDVGRQVHELTPTSAASSYGAYLSGVHIRLAAACCILLAASLYFSLKGRNVEVGFCLAAATLYLLADAQFRFNLSVTRGVSSPLFAQLMEGVHAVPLTASLFLIWAVGEMPPAPLLVIVAATCVLLSSAIMNGALGRAVGRRRPSAARHDFAAGLPFFGGSLLIVFVQWFPIFILSLGSLRAGGEFRAVAQIDAVFLAILAATTTSVTRDVIRGVGNDRGSLRRTIRSARVTSTLLIGPFALVVLVAPERLLDLIFGSEYRTGALALQILAASRFVVALIGPTGVIVTMVGLEWKALQLSLLTAGIFILTAVCLIPLWGATGAAIAVGAEIICRAAGNALIARRRLIELCRLPETL